MPSQPKVYEHPRFRYSRDYCLYGTWGGSYVIVQHPNLVCSKRNYQNGRTTYVTCDATSLALASRSDQRESGRDHINSYGCYATTYSSFSVPHKFFKYRKYRSLETLIASKYITTHTHTHVGQSVVVYL